MGACVSSHHKSSSTKVHRSFGSDQKRDIHTVIENSPVKENLPIIDGNVAVKPQLPPLHSTTNSRDFGSKEEMFFDSQAWLESDCETEFMSVNGEFTPSRGNTPVHHHFSATSPPISGGASAIDDHKPATMTVSQPSTSPVKKSKRLYELFCESRRENRDCDEDHSEAADENGVVGSLEQVAVRGGVLEPKRERWLEIVRVPGCLPRVLSSCRPITHQQTEVTRK